MDALLQDIRFALHGLWRRPGYSLLLAGVLALGIGATSAMFAVVRGALLRPPPFAEPDRVVAVYAPQPEIRRAPFSIPDFIDWRDQSSSLEAMAAIRPTNHAVLIADQPLSLRSLRVSGRYFEVLGLEAAHGRLLTPEDDEQARRVVVLSHETFEQRFESDPSVVGTSLVLDGEPHEVVGVVRDDQPLIGPRCSGELAVPLGIEAPNRSRDFEERGNHGYLALGKLAPGTTVAEAETELLGIAARLEEAYPNTNKNVKAKVMPFEELLEERSRSSLLLLLGAIGFVLLLTCANAANLMLARGAGRKGELALRAALGATRRRIARQLVTESVVLSLLGGAMGILVALWMLDLFLYVLRGSLPVTAVVTLDPWVVAFTVGLALMTGVVTGAAPAWSTSRLDGFSVLKESATRATGGATTSRLRSALVITEVAVAIALCALSSLLLSSFSRLLDVDVGIEPERVATGMVRLVDKRYPDAAGARRFAEQARRSLAEQPGVQGAAVVSRIPLGGNNTNGSVVIEGRPPPLPGESPIVERHRVSPGAFEVLGTDLVRGRDFTDADHADAAPVMIVNEAFAQAFFPNEDPIGKGVHWNTDDQPFAEIVGVVADVRDNGPDERVSLASYLPIAQAPSPLLALVAKMQPGVTDGSARIRAAVQNVDPLQPVFGLRSLEDIVDGKVQDRRSTLVLLGAFAAMAILLAGLGIFGVVAHQTSQRTREMGIRLALGARPRDVVMLVVRQSMGVVGLGIGAGVALALAGARLADQLLFDTSPFDAIIYLWVALGVAAVALVASVLPARRAATVAPASALRYE